MSLKNKTIDDLDGFRTFGPGTYAEEKDKDGNVTQRKCRATLFSEDQVDVYDWESDQVVREVLVMSGCQLPENKQLPLLDSHSRWNGSASVKGSARNIEIKAADAEGDVFFSSTANDIATLAREGHLTDLSVGYKTYAEHTTWIEPGESRMCAGKLYKNDDTKKRLAVRTVWKPFEVSTTPIGADAKAKFRNMYDNNLSKGERNMPIEKTETTPEKPVEKQAIDIEGIRTAARKEAAEAEQARVLEIQTTCREMNVPEEFAKDFITQGMPTTEAVRKVIIEAKRLMTPAPQGGDTRIGKDETDKFRGAAVTGLLLRSGYPTQKIEQKERDAVEKTEFRGSSIHHLARFILERAGVRGVHYMDKFQLADAIINHCSARTTAQGTGDFPYILAAAGNEFLQNSYVETPTTYQVWVKFMGLDDFKQNKIVNISLFSDIKRWPEGVAPEQGKYGEKQETITLYKYGGIYSIPYEALVNDDKDVFSRIPSTMGAACARMRNLICYNLLFYGNTEGTGSGTVGPTMNEDSKAMFHADHANILSSLAPGATALAAAEAALAKIKLPAPDSTSKTQYTNASIKFLLCSRGKKFLWQQVIFSGTVVEMTTGVNVQANPAIENPFKNSGIVLVSEPIIDSISSTLWYAAADPNQIGHITMGNLNGINGPQIRSEPSAIGAAKGISYEVLDCFGAAAEDWRGMCKNAGA
jgi:hypothetical protein